MPITVMAVIRNVSGSPADSILVCGELGTTPTSGPDVWADTQVIGTLAPFAETLVAFDPCTILGDVGEGYWLTVYVDYGDTNPDNDTCQTYQVLTTRLQRYDDGGYEDALVLPDSGSAWGVDFYSPFESGETWYLEEIWWQVRCDWPDMDREPVNLYVFEMVNDTPATVPLWGPICDTAGGCGPDFAVHELDPPLRLPDSVLIAIEQLTDFDDVDAVVSDKSWLRWGVGPSYWDHYWKRSPGDSWTKLDATDTTSSGTGNILMRGLMSSVWEPHDVMVWSFNDPGPTVHPHCWCHVGVEATVKNVGIYTETFGVECLIENGSTSIVFADTVEVTQLAPLSYEDVSFSWWHGSPPPGSDFGIELRTLLGSDYYTDNDTVSSTTEISPWARWNDGMMEDAEVWAEPGGRFAVEFSQPCACSVEKIRWMIHEDWPDGPGVHEVDLEIYRLPDTSLVWSVSNAPTTAGNPFWSEYTVPTAEVPVLSHFLVAVVQRGDSVNSDGLGVDAISRYWGRDWKKPPGGDWQTPQYGKNLMIAVEMGRCLHPPWGFIRGDLDTVAGVNIGDVIYLLKFLYVPGAEPPSCMDAADVDDAGPIDTPTMGDAIYLLNWLYIPGSPPPPEPYGEGVYPWDCGTDFTLDMMDCVDHHCDDWCYGY